MTKRRLDAKMSLYLDNLMSRCFNKHQRENFMARAKKEIVKEHDVYKSKIQIYLKEAKKFERLRDSAQDVVEYYLEKLGISHA